MNDIKLGRYNKEANSQGVTFLVRVNVIRNM